MLFSEPKIPHFREGVRIASITAPFQCSSASRKFLTLRDRRYRCNQKAFQCSSASRKFLTASPSPNTPVHAEFQCSSASRKFLTLYCAVGERDRRRVSVLFSEPKIPHSSKTRRGIITHSVSVLFSEPKIPHLGRFNSMSSILTFQCSSASRKFLTRRTGSRNSSTRSFSALQRAENSSPNAARGEYAAV